MASVHPISHSGTENGLLGSSQTVMWWMLALLYGLVWCSLGGPFLTILTNDFESAQNWEGHPL